MWKKKFKIAIIQKDVAGIEKLLTDIPTLDNIEDMQETMYLIEEALSIFQNLKRETSSTMKAIEKNLLFLESMQNSKASKIDIKS